MVPGGTQIWVGQGCAAQASKPIPIFKGDFGQKGYPFLRIFVKNKAILGLFFQNFVNLGVFAWQKPQKLQTFVLIQKSWPMFKDFFGKKRDPCLRISCKKATLTERHIPVWPNMWVTPPPGWCQIPQSWQWWPFLKVDF